MKRPTLYRFYSEDDTVLYIGRTIDPVARFRQHRQDKPWWDEVVRIDIDRYETDEDLAVAERDAIKAERPRYNVVFNRLRGRAAGEFLRANGWSGSINRNSWTHPRWPYMSATTPAAVHLEQERQQ